MSIRLLTSAILLALAAGSADAQILRGRITDAESRRPLPAASLTLLDEQGQQLALVISDSVGAFELRPPRPGSYSVRVELIGYASLTTEAILMRSAEIVQVAVRMSTQAVPIDPLVITARERGRDHLAEFEQRRRSSGTGFFVTRSQIEARPISTAASLVFSTPGVTVLQDQRIVMHGGGIASPDQLCTANIYIDGVLFNPSTVRNLDDVLIPEWIEGVEVYTRAKLAPAQYQPNDCGSVLFWTRERRGEGSWSWTRIVGAFALAAGTILMIAR